MKDIEALVKEALEQQWAAGNAHATFGPLKTLDHWVPLLCATLEEAQAEIKRLEQLVASYELTRERGAGY